MEFDSSFYLDIWVARLIPKKGVATLKVTKRVGGGLILSFHLSVRNNSKYR